MAAKRLTDTPADVAAAAQRVWLAGLGAAAFAQEEGGRLLALLVSMGEQTEKQLRKARLTARLPAGLSPRAAVAGAANAAEDVWKRVQTVLDAQITTGLHRLGVPTREEIAALTRRIEALTASIEGLRVGRPARARKAAGPRKTTGTKRTRTTRR
jgi:poly(hydroxyalkanoate) granule-associated protein